MNQERYSIADIFADEKKNPPAEITPPVENVPSEPPKSNVIYYQIVMACLVISIIFLFNTINSTKQSAEKEISSLKANITSLVNRQNDLIFDNNRLSYNSAYSQRIVKRYDEIVGFVSKNDKYYHTLECFSQIVVKEYYAYNKELAKYKGYKPCPKCQP